MNFQGTCTSWLNLQKKPSENLYCLISSLEKLLTKFHTHLKLIGEQKCRNQTSSLYSSSQQATKLNQNAIILALKIIDIITKISRVFSSFLFSLCINSQLTKYKSICQTTVICSI